MYLKTTTVHKGQLTTLNVDGEIGNCILKSGVNSMMDKITLAKGDHPLSMGNLRINLTSVSFHVGYVRKEQRSVL